MSCSSLIMSSSQGTDVLCDRIWSDSVCQGSNVVCRRGVLVILLPARTSLTAALSQDILSGIEHTKHGNVIASQHRKKQAFIASRLAGYVVTSLNTTGVGFVKTMTDVERHAELTFAESLFEKVNRVVYLSLRHRFLTSTSGTAWNNLFGRLARVLEGGVRVLNISGYLSL